MSRDDKEARDRKSGAVARAERLAAELKANLKKRKEQARARQHARSDEGWTPARDKDKSDG
jgi:hypothetical protein